MDGSSVKHGVPLRASSAMLLVILSLHGCGSDPVGTGSTAGVLTVTTSSIGHRLDKNGFDLTIGSMQTHIQANDSLTFTGLVAGQYTVSLDDIESNCAATEAIDRIIDIDQGITVKAAFEFTCQRQLAFAVQFGATRHVDIVLVNEDGTGLKNLTNSPVIDRGVSWSPDGERMAFERITDNQVDIYVMNADGTGMTQLTTSTANDSYPNWSPAGDMIIFSSNRDGNSEIYGMSPDGDAPINLTNNSAIDGGLLLNQHVWSPAGDAFVFFSDRSETRQVFTVATNGSGVTQVTNDTVSILSAMWSPDGNLIAYERGPDPLMTAIYTIGVTGGPTSNITQGDYTGLGLMSWRPDGSMIAFKAKWADDLDHIYTATVDGTNVQWLTADRAFESSANEPVWSLDGELIAFRSNRDEALTELYLMNADGTEVRRLTVMPDDIEGNHRWRP